MKKSKTWAHYPNGKLTRAGKAAWGAGILVGAWALVRALGSSAPAAQLPGGPVVPPAGSPGAT